MLAVAMAVALGCLIQAGASAPPGPHLAVDCDSITATPATAATFSTLGAARDALRSHRAAAAAAAGAGAAHPQGRRCRCAQSMPQPPLFTPNRSDAGASTAQQDTRIGAGHAGETTCQPQIETPNGCGAGDRFGPRALLRPAQALRPAGRLRHLARRGRCSAHGWAGAAGGQIRPGHRPDSAGAAAERVRRCGQAAQPQRARPGHQRHRQAQAAPLSGRECPDQLLPLRGQRASRALLGRGGAPPGAVPEQRRRPAAHPSELDADQVGAARRERGGSESRQRHALRGRPGRPSARQRADEQVGVGAGCRARRLGARRV